MNTQKEMYAAKVKNWLMDLATGAKAAQKKMQFAPAELGSEWRVTTSCYNQMEDGVAVHDIKHLAEVIDVPVKFGTFTEDEYHNDRYVGYYYIELFGVRFWDYVFNGEEN